MTPLVFRARGVFVCERPKSMKKFGCSVFYAYLCGCMKRRGTLALIASVLLMLAGCIADEVGGVYLVTDEVPKFYSVANHGAKIIFNAGGKWKATTSAPWLAVTPEQGNGGRDTLTVSTAAMNRTKQERSAVLTIESDGKQKQLTICQGADYAIFDEHEIEVGPEGDTLSIGFSSNISRDSLYVSYQLLDWIGWTEPIDKTRADWHGRLKSITVMPNIEPAVRRAFFVLITYGRKEEILPMDTVWVIQKGLSL